jgi:hypothetical protein
VRNDVTKLLIVLIIKALKNCIVLHTTGKDRNPGNGMLFCGLFYVDYRLLLNSRKLGFFRRRNKFLVFWRYIFIRHEA